MQGTDKGVAGMIERYANGVALLRQALAEVPEEAMQWQPAPGKWSVHEVICHCADSETNASMRIRYLVGEDQPVIAGYDQDRWTTVFNYHALPIEPSLAQIESVRAWTVAFLRRLPDSAWSRAGTHTEMPGQAYTAELWLSIYSEHLDVHAAQIRRNVAAWNSRRT